jgi:hypothetical protein
MFKPSSKYVKKDFAKEMIKVAQPVLVWLEEAEEGTESSDSEDIAVAFDDRSRNIGIIVEEKETNKKVEGEATNGNAKSLDNNKDEEGDVDIDNI